MGKISLLDCTLRDGGYVNDWEYGHDNIISIFERMVDANVDIIEIGFLDDRRPFDINRSIMPDTESVGRIYGNLNRKSTMVVAMIDYGTCDISNIKPCSESFLDGIRVIFKKHLREPALAYCKQLAELGYKVFANLVSITTYSDEEMLDLIRFANEADLYAVSMVDTYGLMHQENLLHYFDLLNDNLNENITLAYHGHNNFQMGYANCIAVLAKEIKRDFIVDGSIYGMGKSAGNAPIELIAMHLNEMYEKNYNISQILEAIDANITQFYKPATWGYNMFFYIAALNKCHPNYVKQLMNKRTLSVKSINEILQGLEGEKKLLYDKEYGEKLYVEYQAREINDEQALKQLRELFESRTILVTGPGKSIMSQTDDIKNFISENNPLVISINAVASIVEPDFIFLSNSKRYVQLATRLSENNYKIIATSNVTSTGGDEFEYSLNFSSLMDEDAEFIDNSLIMLLKALIKTGVSEVYLAGFDGYRSDTDNYYNMEMEYEFVKSKADYLNSYTKEFIYSVEKDLAIHFITKSIYQEV